MEIIKCPNCGAQSLSKNEDNLLRCNYCDSIINIKSKVVEEKRTSQTIQSTPNRVQPPFNQIGDSNYNRLIEKDICPECNGELKPLIPFYLMLILCLVFSPFFIIVIIFYMSFLRKKRCTKCKKIY